MRIIKDITSNQLVHLINKVKNLIFLPWFVTSCVLFPHVKGLDHSSTGLHLVSNMIKEALGISDISVLMGANLAKEVAREMFGEATIGKTEK